MSSLTWRLNSAAEDQDDLPACTSCRKRKLRCSRDVPTCRNCNRIGGECVYDAKSKPGLKTGAVEALSRRLATLEKLLLDDKGVPFVTFKRDANQHIYQPTENGAAHRHSKGDAAPIISNDGDATEWPFPTSTDTSQCSPHCERITRQEEPDAVDAFGYPNNDDDLMMRSLPQPEILIKVVDYFCTSFHHWIPFLHKAKCKTEVRRPQVSSDFVPILHALVAVCLPRLGVKYGEVDHKEIHRQTRLSRSLALRFSVLNANLQSLETLLILVFEQVNNGLILETCPLIALLVRTVDFLQLTKEPGTSRSQALMKPLETLEAATDWTELEARRRLFWCIFILDRYTSAHTGWNTSLTAEDVQRRLPADGGYFTREEPVNCPLFGLWNKAFASLGSPLSTHIPTQYREQSPSAHYPDADSTTPGSQANIDSSKLGAFAYSIEAVESLHQVTTFFLQQRINWQNRQHVLDWLTRFKELDLRLIHWKTLLPPRWKDSDISIDTTRIDMDPNLTLAHLTHNASMILLHYPVAFPPREWAGLVQFPSSCSRETCQMAAIEISRITEKFLRHTSIPFVSPQFSFCVFVAAKLLLATSHQSKELLLPEFNTLLRSLWQIANLWLYKGEEGVNSSGQRLPSRTVLDLAGSYAFRLEELNQQYLEDDNFRFDFFDHSSCKKPEHVSTTPTASQITATHRTTGTTGESVSTPQTASSRRKRRNSQKRTSELRSAAIARSRAQKSPGSSLGPPTQSPLGPELYNRAPAAPNLGLVSPQPDDRMQYGPHLQSHQDPNDVDWLQGSLFDLSNTLMHPQFLEQDRVITFEDTYFQTSNMGWS